MIKYSERNYKNKKSNYNSYVMNQVNQLSHIENEDSLNIKNSDILLSKLEKYALTSNIINKYSSSNSTNETRENAKQNAKQNENAKQNSKQNINENENENENEKDKPTEKKVLHNFSPSEKDKLFWCFYIFLYGFEEYEIAKSSSFITEKNFKIKTVEKMPSFKEKIKEMKLKLNEVQDELVNQPIISIKSLQVLCLIYDINIFFIKNRTIYEIIVNDKPIKTIINDNNNIHMIDDINEEKLTYYRNNYWKIDNLSKPLSAFSSYSLTELQDICKKLEIPITTDGKKIQKKDLYQSILTKI